MSFIVFLSKRQRYKKNRMRAINNYKLLTAFVEKFYGRCFEFNVNILKNLIKLFLFI
jgi:hypothetical protein